jgi:Protein of unknown function (DUF3320)
VPGIVSPTPFAISGSQTSWYRDRAGQEDRLRTAIEEAIRRQSEAKQTAEATGANEDLGRIIIDPIGVDQMPDWCVLYEVASPSPPAYPIDMHEQSAREDLRRMIREVVAIEGPVSSETVLRRVREAWGVRRAGTRIRDAFDRSVGLLERRNEVRKDEDGFLYLLPGTELTVRAAVPGQPSTSREIDEVPPSEIRLAIVGVVRDNHLVGWDELTAYVARIFGWGRREAGIAGVLDDAVFRLIETGEIAESDGWLKPASISSEEARPTN